jgi:hypothetical protein
MSKQCDHRKPICQGSNGGSLKERSWPNQKTQSLLSEMADYHADHREYKCASRDNAHSLQSNFHAISQ